MKLMPALPESIFDICYLIFCDHQRTSAAEKLP